MAYQPFYYLLGLVSVMNDGMRLVAVNIFSARHYSRKFIKVSEIIKSRVVYQFLCISVILTVSGDSPATKEVSQFCDHAA